MGIKEFIRHLLVRVRFLVVNLFLTHRILVDSSTFICRTNPFVILRVSGLFCRFYF